MGKGSPWQVSNSKGELYVIRVLAVLNIVPRWSDLSDVVFSMSTYKQQRPGEQKEANKRASKAC